MPLRQPTDSEIRKLAEAMPFPVIEWHHTFGRGRRDPGHMTIRVNREIAYDGPWSKGLQKLVDGCTNATLVYAAIKGAFDEDESA